MDFPQLIQSGLPGGTIGTFSMCSQAGNAMAFQANFSGATLTWTTANQVCYVPVMVATRLTVYQMFWGNGATLGGNMDAGIYDEGLTLLVNVGTTAQAGTSAIQVANCTDTELDPGLYYFALQNSTTTATFAGAGMSNSHQGRYMGLAQQSPAGLPLPSTATFATWARPTVPLIGAVWRSATI